MEETVTLRVRDGTSEILFKIRRNTPILRVKEAYCSKRGIGNVDAHFFINGLLINDLDTALTLELEDNDVVEVSVNTQVNYNDKTEHNSREDLLNELEESTAPKKNAHGAQLRVIILSRETLSRKFRRMWSNCLPIGTAYSLSK